jgi:glycosyltransferase involved in cell wall biosynthesis
MGGSLSKSRKRLLAAIRLQSEFSDSSTVKILAFSNCPLDPALGSGRTRLAWSAGLRALGHEVQVLGPDELLPATPEAAAGRRLRLGWHGWRWLKTHDLSDVDLIEFYGAEFWPATWRLAAREIGRRPFLAAHTDGLELLAAARVAAIAVASPPAGAPPAQAPWRAAAARLLRHGEKMAFSRADGFVTGCALDRRYLLDHGIGNPARMEVIPPGLEPLYLALPEPSPQREERVAFLGSWIERKGTAHLVRTMIPLLESRPELRLDLLGVGCPEAVPLAEFPVALRARIAVAPRLAMADMTILLQRARVFFFPSEYEGFGLGLAEAMACGCPVVTTPTGFGAELADGREALLCAFGDVAAMGAAVARLLDDETLRAHVALAGWQRVQNLHWETSVRRLEQTYLRWLAARPAAA